MEVYYAGSRDDAIRVEVFGEGMAELVAVLKKAILDVSITNISMIENGKRVVGPRTAKKLAAALDLDYRRLL